MAQQNGRTSFTLPDSAGGPPRGSNGAGLLADAHRRRDRLIRREAYTRTSTRYNVTEAHGYTDEQVDKAAQAMYDLMRVGKLTVQQVQAEQREDANRLAGWKAVGMPEGASASAEKVSAIQYRMAVRNRALELQSVFDLTSGTSQTRTRDAITQPSWKPWRKGAEFGGTGY